MTDGFSGLLNKSNIFNFEFFISFLGLIIKIEILTIKLSTRIELPNMVKSYFHNLGGFYKRLTENKTMEFELTFSNEFQTGIKFNKNIHCHHSNICLELSLFGFTLRFQIYDNRHWDDENNKYEEYN